MKPIKPPEKKSASWSESFVLGAVVAVSILFSMAVVATIIGFFK